MRFDIISKVVHNEHNPWVQTHRHRHIPVTVIVLAIIRWNCEFIIIFADLCYQQ
jgi:hypothetical protein